MELLLPLTSCRSEAPVELQERDELLNQITGAVRDGQAPSEYRTPLVKLREAGLTPEEIDAEVRDRVARLRQQKIENLKTETVELQGQATERGEEIRRLQVWRKGLFFGGIGVLILTLVAFTLGLLALLKPTPTPPPASPTVVATATPAPTAAPIGHWQFTVVPGPAEFNVRVVDVLVLNKEGTPAPDGLRVTFFGTPDAVQPQVATTHDGLVRLMLSTKEDAAEVKLKIQADTDSRDIRIQVATPTATPITPVVSIPTPTIPAPTAEPITLTLALSPTFVVTSTLSVVTADIGISETITVTVRATQADGKPAVGTAVTLTLVPADLAGLTPTRGATDAEGKLVVRLTGQKEVEATLTASAAAAQAVTATLRVHPSAILKVGGNIRAAPDGLIVRATIAGEPVVIYGQYTSAKRETWWRIRRQEGDLAWVWDGNVAQVYGDASKAPVVTPDQPSSSAATATPTPVPAPTPTPSQSGSAAPPAAAYPTLGTRLVLPKSGGQIRIYPAGNIEDSKTLAWLPGGRSVEVLPTDKVSGLETAPGFVLVEIRLWVKVEFVVRQGGRNQLINSTGREQDACWDAPQNNQITVQNCGKLMPNASGYAASPDSLERDGWKQAVLWAWVKRENVE